MNWSLKIISPEDTYAIRHKVLWPDASIEQVKIKGDESALHIGLFIDDKHIGVVSLFANGQNMQFRKLAILPEFQGLGAGSALIAQCMAIASKQGATMLWCDARQEALRFYEKLGFEIDPVVFIKSGLPYQKAFMRTTSYS